jgi:hypothetical protein
MGLALLGQHPSCQRRLASVSGDEVLLDLARKRLQLSLE